MSGVGTYIQGLPSWAKGLIVVAIILIVVTIIVSVNKAIKKSKEAKSFEDDFKNYCKQGSKPSYPEATYLSLAGKIEEAGCSGIFCYGTDEDAIYDVFRQMNSDCDVILLKRAFGKRDERGGICYSDLWGSSCGVELGVWLQSELSSSNFEEINKILSSKGITSRF